MIALIWALGRFHCGSLVTSLGLVAHILGICNVSLSSHILAASELYSAYTNIKEMSAYKRMLKLIK